MGAIPRQSGIRTRSTRPGRLQLIRADFALMRENFDTARPFQRGWQPFRAFEICRILNLPNAVAG